MKQSSRATLPQSSQISDDVLKIIEQIKNDKKMKPPKHSRSKMMARRLNHKRIQEFQNLAEVDQKLIQTQRDLFSGAVNSMPSLTAQSSSNYLNTNVSKRASMNIDIISRNDAQTGNLHKSSKNKSQKSQVRRQIHSNPHHSLFRPSIAGDTNSSHSLSTASFHHKSGGISAKVHQENLLINSYIRRLSPIKQFKKERILENDSQKVMNSINAAMSNLLVSEHEKYKIIPPDRDEKVEVYTDVPVFLKLNLRKQIPPLTINFGKIQPQNYIQVYISYSSKGNQQKVYLNPHKIIKQKFTENWLYFTIKSPMDVVLELKASFQKVQQKKQNSSDEDSSDHEIDVQNFNLGPGTWQEKKVRIENFVHKLTENKCMLREFKSQAKTSRNDRIEMNQSLAPKFKELKNQHIKILTTLNLIKQETAKQTRERQQMEKFICDHQKMQKWNLYRIKKLEIEKQELQKVQRIRAVKDWISFILTIKIKQIPEHVRKISEARMRIYMIACSAFQIQKAWKKYKKRIGSKLKFYFTASSTFLSSTLEYYSALHISFFLQHYFKGLKLTLKIRHYLTKVYRIQRALKQHHTNNEDRLEIMEYRYSEAFKKLQMELFKKSNKRLEEKLRKVHGNVKKNLLVRYLRYCQDQYVFTYLEWRKKVQEMQMNKKERILFGVKLAFSKSEREIRLRNQYDEVNYDPEKLGRQVQSVPKCLGGEEEGRHLEQTPEIQEIRKAQSISELVDCYPREHFFNPTDEVMRKIVMQSLQIQDELVLWEGFHPIYRGDGKKTWHPDSLE